MTDPWDDAGRSQAGFVVTGAGLRVPVAAPTALGGWPATPGRRSGRGARRCGASGVPWRGSERLPALRRARAGAGVRTAAARSLPRRVSHRREGLEGTDRLDGHSAERAHARGGCSRRHRAWPPAPSTTSFKWLRRQAPEHRVACVGRPAHAPRQGEGVEGPSESPELNHVTHVARGRRRGRRHFPACLAQPPSR